MGYVWKFAFISESYTSGGSFSVKYKYQSCFNFWWKAKTTLTTWDHVEKAELKAVFTTKDRMQSQEKAK